MEKVVFELFGLTLYEPLSTIMNWVLAIQCGIYYRKLQPVTDPAQRWWKWFFLGYSVSLTFGGASHLFYEYTGMLGKIPGWTFAILAVACAELAMIQLLEDSKKVQLLKTVVRSKLFATFVLLVMDFGFKWVAVQTVGLLFFVGIIGWQKHQTGHQYARHFFDWFAVFGGHGHRQCP